MALTFTIQEKPTGMGHRFRTVTVVAADNSYPTGGYSMKPSDLGFASTADPATMIQVQNTYGYGWRYDYSAQKLLFYTSAGTQTSNATDLSALTDIRVVAWGQFRA